MAEEKPKAERVVETHVKELFGATFTIKVSLPLSYKDKPSEQYNTLFLVDLEDGHFESAAASASEAHATTVTKERRNWFPELIVASVSGGGEATPDMMIGGATQFLLPFMDQSYRTYPYAAGRTLMGRAIALAALRNDDIMKMFQNYVLVSPESAEGVGGEGRAKMLDNTAILLTASKGDGETTLAAARACKAALDTRAGGPDAAQATTTVMQVDRHGEQQYRQEATLGFLIELRELDGAGRDELVRDGVVWVCERVEKRKLERLGSLLPWHEFK